LTSLELSEVFFERAHRHRVNTKAWIRHEGSFATQHCRVLDVSRTGVRLEVANAYKIPDDFTLLLSKSGVGHHAKIVWRGGTQVGAEFFLRLKDLALFFS
jgi:hypothetical protein